MPAKKTDAIKRGTSEFYEAIKKDLHRQYIHLQREHVGRMYGGKSYSKDAAIVLKKNRNVKNIVLNDYKKLFASTLNDETRNIFNQLTELEQQQFIEGANEALKDSLEKVSMDKLATLYDLKKNFISPGEMLQMSQQDFYHWDKILDPIVEAIKLIETEAGGEICLASLLQPGYKHITSTKRHFSRHIQQALDKYLSSNNFEILSDERQAEMRNICRVLQNLVQNIATAGKNKNMKTMTKDGWQEVFNNLFSADFAETLAARAFQHAFAASEDMVFEAVGRQQAQGQGKTTFIKGEYQTQNRSITQKTDIKGHNIQLSFKEKTSIGNISDFTIDLGISMKFYESMAFKPLGKTGSKTFSSGSGGSLATALVDTYGTGAKKIYFARNVLAHGNTLENEAALGSLHDALLTREILRLFASAGSGDFSHFILVNGEFISMWDLLKYVIDKHTDFKLSSSSQGTSKQGVSISIDGRKEIIAANTKEQETGSDTVVALAKQRSNLVNQRIDKAKIMANIHIEKLARAFAAQNRR